MELLRAKRPKGIDDFVEGIPQVMAFPMLHTLREQVDSLNATNFTLDLTTLLARFNMNTTLMHNSSCSKLSFCVYGAGARHRNGLQGCEGR
jgi:hypothetical protein